MATDLYAALGIEKSATSDEVRKAYRKKAMETHPDREGGSDEAFKTVQRAGEVLLDEQARREYDETGRMPGDEPSLRDRVQAMMDDMLDKLGEPNFPKILREIKRDLSADRKNLEKELATAKANLATFETSLTQFTDKEMSSGILELAGLRRARLAGKIKQAENHLAFMEATMALLAPIQEAPPQKYTAPSLEELIARTAHRF